MAKAAGRTSNKRGRKTAKADKRKPFRPIRFVLFLLLRSATVLVVLTLALVLLFAAINPPITHTIWAEQRRLGAVERDWVAIEQIAPVMARSVRMPISACTGGSTSRRSAPPWRRAASAAVRRSASKW